MGWVIGEMELNDSVYSLYINIRERFYFIENIIYTALTWLPTKGIDNDYRDV
jgi:hypothetical protein